MLVDARNVAVVVGGVQSLDAVRAVARGAGDELLLDVFKLTHDDLARDVAKAALRGRVGVLLDPEFVTLQHRGTLASARASLVEYGAMPAKNHAKAIVGREGAITTAALIPETAGRFDLTALLDDASTASLRQLLRSYIYGSEHDVVVAARAVGAHGIVLNDPLRGVYTLTRGVEELIDSARSRLLVVTKQVRDHEMVERIAMRAEDGVDTGLATRTVRGADQDRLQGAGAAVHELGVQGGSIHGNAIVADGRAYIGTGYMHHRSLGRGASARPTREVGVITSDPTAVATIERAIRDRIARG